MCATQRLAGYLRQIPLNGPRRPSPGLRTFVERVFSSRRAQMKCISRVRAVRRGFPCCVMRFQGTFVPLIKFFIVTFLNNLGFSGSASSHMICSTCLIRVQITVKMSEVPVLLKNNSWTSGTERQICMAGG